MSPETPLAFDSLDARANASAGADPLDRISLRDHVVEVEIGAFQTERGSTQRVSFDVVVEVARHHGPLDDNVDRILSYDTITDAITYELAAERLNLLETLAERIGERILLKPLAQRVFVRVQKLDRGPGALGVEIVRNREETRVPESGADDAIPHPMVVFLSNQAICSPNLTNWIDELAAQTSPVVLCVGSADTVSPKSNVAMAQRRIDLLSVEQNAWVLAGQDPRCVVVDSRTELDWAARHGKMSVWAPSRVVLDAVEDTVGHIGGGRQLASWFATWIKAERLVFVGASIPDGCDVPCNAVPETSATVL